MWLALATFILSVTAYYLFDLTLLPLATGRVQAAGVSPGAEVTELNGSDERDLGPNQTHLYRITLSQAQYVRLSLRPYGIRVRAMISDETGRALIQTPCAEMRPVNLSWIAAVTGPYMLEVAACEEEAISGNYEVRIEEKREAGAGDGDRVGAAMLTIKADGLRGEGSGDAIREALRNYEEALRLFTVVGDRAGEASTLRKMGKILHERGDRSESLAHLKRALAAARLGNDTYERIKILNDLGTLQTDIGDFKAALADSSSALELSVTHKDEMEKARALSNVGMVNYYSGELREALGRQREASIIWRDLRDRRGQAESLLRMGYVFTVQGEPGEALTAYGHALSLYRSVDDRRGEALALTALGQAHIDGDRQKALDYLDQADPLAERMESLEISAYVCSAKGVIFYHLGELKKSLRYREKALELFRAMPDRWGESAMHRWVGRIYREMGDEQRALDHFRQGMDIARSTSSAHLESVLLREVGDAYGQAGDAQKALENYRKSLSVARRSGDPRDEADALSRIGGAYGALGRNREALIYFGRALPLARSVSDRAAEAQTLSNIARAQRDLGRLEEAKTQIEAALEIVESLRTSIASPKLRTSYFATVRHQYDLYIDVLMRLDRHRPSHGFAAAAFGVSERARARTLLETLKEAGANIRRGVDPALAEQERALRQGLGAKAERYTQLLAAGQKDEAGVVAKEIDDLVAQHDRAATLIRSDSPRYAALMQPKPLTLDEVQRHVLDDDTLLLEYALGEERSYMWAATRTGAASYELPARKVIEDAARAYYNALTAEQPRPGESYEERRARAAQADAQLGDLSARLGDMLLGPVAAHPGKKRLLIIPDGALQYIPFQALAAPSPQHGGGERVPLVTTHEVANEPSASALALLLDETARRKPAPGLLAVFADPVFEADDPRLRSGGVTGERAGRDRGGEGTRALSEGAGFGSGGRIHRLLASRGEARAIVSSAEAGSVLRALDFDANLTTATRPDLARYRIIHFATHGLLDSERPELSGLVLSLFNADGTPRDGFLRMQDIYNLNLSADLVVLSACSTGLGKEVKGEGMIGITRGFMYAGSAGVVASLWKVDDEATAELMKLFYGFMLKDGLAPAAALREAQLSMMRQKRWRAPYYWSAFVIQGTFAGRENPGRNLSAAPARLASAAIGAVALSLATIYIVRRKRKRVLPG